MRTENPAPVAIGGLGGSGTRVFSALLQHAGVYMGAELNKSLDNLWFTVLFKQQRFVVDGAAKDALDQATRMFVTAMTKGLGGVTAPNDLALLDHLRQQMPPHGTWRCGASAPHVDSLINSAAQGGVAQTGWGWKEPNTHIFLPDLDARIPNLRYIHIVRDGLDMAFSGNTWQLDHWGAATRDADLAQPVAQLRFWTHANQRALEYGMTQMGARFMAISYEDFCQDPKPYWDRISAFLDQEVTAPFPTDLVKVSTIGRSAGHDLSIFSAADLDAAAQVANLVRSLRPV